MQEPSKPKFHESVFDARGLERRIMMGGVLLTAGIVAFSAAQALQQLLSGLAVH